MTYRWCGAVGVMSVLAVLTPALAGAQSTTVPVTSWGDPDLQGTWTNTTTTPMERPLEFSEQLVLTDEQRAEIDAEAERNRDRPPPPGRTGGYNSFWMDRGYRSEQTSLVIDPPDGRLPEKTDRVREKDAAFEAARAGGDPDSWEDLNLYDRCITRGDPGGDDSRCPDYSLGEQVEHCAGDPSMAGALPGVLGRRHPRRRDPSLPRARRSAGKESRGGR